MLVASAMNSSISRTWVQEASLLSRTPSAADIERPEAQMPSNPALLHDLGGEPVVRLHDEGRGQGPGAGPRRRAALDVVAACASALPMGSRVAMKNRRFVARSSMNLTYRDDIKGVTTSWRRCNAAPSSCSCLGHSPHDDAPEATRSELSRGSLSGATNRDGAACHRAITTPNPIPSRSSTSARSTGRLRADIDAAIAACSGGRPLRPGAGGGRAGGGARRAGRRRPRGPPARAGTRCPADGADGRGGRSGRCGLRAGFHLSRDRRPWWRWWALRRFSSMVDEESCMMDPADLCGAGPRGWRTRGGWCRAR